jgi:hypothetical protein
LKTLTELWLTRYARDSSELGYTREMDVPCTYDKLAGDFRPPFTCGSQTRRSIIKYFVRDFLNAKQVGGSLINKLVRQHINRLQESWADSSKFACHCANRKEHKLECCNPAGSTQQERAILYDPSAVKVPVDMIRSEDVMRVVLEELRNYFPTLWTNSEPFTKYTTPAGKSEWDWSSGEKAKTAKDSGIFNVKKPVISYDDDEIGWPFKVSQTS